VRVISDSISEEPIRKSVLEKKYMKTFTGSIVLLIFGILLLSISTLIVTFGDPQTQLEYEVMLRTISGFSTFSQLFLQLGMVLFSLSTFLGAVRDKTLSGEVRKGMAAASAIGILALGIILITININIPFF
jgi:hypothetical protein